ncbi:hypothetical protein SPRG_16723 [Saprolegnia parasitica CBS 223.65]|uniref:Uncharacterized protein n=1 Tax=Saprolegnia parasitica (strain CBS 223.65) TaxID=695850 RepID=A0A067BMA2_SAPPC|nr:hypothetical protein SPRG_16723 [Saprolegnia parasitica CBS 223.65]KDO17865.1 hypothetical protein SPRG_16723 [Saprolegnia parasitica CBS 223.65]|eukprot:XP_012211428.1 hypothetical protein SPRG_16723 [Saprolegnia parasitica CBS 223.65]
MLPSTVCTFTECSRHAMPGANKCLVHKNKLKCSRDGCHNQVYARYLCVRHGGKKQCQTPGCRASVSRGSFCTDHGGGVAKRLCSEPGCHSQAHARYKCVRHGGGRGCRHKGGCPMYARYGGFCRRHATDSVSTKREEPIGVTLPFFATPAPLEKSENHESMDDEILYHAIDNAILTLLCESLASMSQGQPGIPWSSLLDEAPLCSISR